MEWIYFIILLLFISAAPGMFPGWPPMGVPPVPPGQQAAVPGAPVATPGAPATSPTAPAPSVGTVPLDASQAQVLHAFELCVFVFVCFRVHGICLSL